MTTGRAAGEDGAADDRDLDVFTRHRSLLFTLAYELLGSVADAEDVVQETWLRWSARPDPEKRAPVEHPRAYLVRIATRLALNRLRTLARRREDYVGPWLPEPLLTTPDVLDDVVLAESVSLALLVVLESLSPAERAVFVLREVFGYEVAEVAAAVDKSSAAVRQLAHRAREHVAARRPRFDADLRTSAEVGQRFVRALGDRDVQGLMDVLAPDVVLLSDSGGKAQAARRPVRGADPVSRFLVGVAAKGANALAGAEPVLVNGAPAWTYRLAGGIAAAQLQIEGGRVTGVFLMVNPDKSAGLTGPRSLARTVERP